MKRVRTPGPVAELEGLKIRKNVTNNFAVIELDFVADPAKRDPEWINEQKRSMPPKQWAVEMMRSWETFAGRPVYDGTFFPHLHILKARREPDPNYPIFRGWDFGGSQSCTIGQIVGPRLYVTDEIPNGGMNTETFAPQVIAFCGSNYGSNFHFIDIIDPSAMWDTTRARAESSCADVMRELDLHPIPAPTNDPKKRIGAVIKLLRTLGADGRPNLQLNPGCTMLIKGFTGGYHYPEKPSQSRKADQPVKNLFSHIHDALQYIAVRLASYEKDRSESTQYELQHSNPLRYRFSSNKKRTGSF